MKKTFFMAVFMCTAGLTGWAQNTERLSFGVISDIHFGNSVGEGPMVKVPQALKNLTAHGQLDALAVVGDLTDGGHPEQYAQLTQVFSDPQTFTTPVGEFLFMMGNHDNYNSEGKAAYQEGLKAFNGGQPYPFNAYKVIKGYPFITVSMSGSQGNDISNPDFGLAAYPASTVEWLKSSLEQAAKECPGKPIFVFTHVPPRWSCYSTWPEFENGSGWCMKILNPVLNQYPQAVVFGGHSHYPIGDPRSIHQGANPRSERQNYYTVINTGSTTYSEIHPGAVDAGIHPAMYDYVTEGLILTELENGDIEVRRYDTYRNEEIGATQRWVLKAPFDGSRFQYADIRDADDNPDGKALRNGLPAPAFADDAELSIEPGAYDVKVVIPQATDDECVFRYDIHIKKDGMDVIVAQSSVFSQFYLNSQMPRQLEVMVGDLIPETDYQLEVVAYDSYENASTTLSTTFSTAADDDPANEVPMAYERWTFDNVSDLLASDMGQATLEALTMQGQVLTLQPDAASAGIVSIEGPSLDNGAVLIPANAGLKASLYLGGTSQNYALQFDLRVKDAYPFDALFQTDLENKDDADCFISKNKIGVGDLGYHGSVQNNTWHRIMLVNRDGQFSAYIDGKLANTASKDRWTINGEGVLFFVDNDGEKVDTEVAEIAFWDAPLTEGQMRRLGKINTDGFMELFTTKLRLVDRTDFTIKVNTNVRLNFELPEWIEAVDVAPHFGVKEYAFRLLPMEHPGSRTGIISISGADQPEQTVEVTQVSVGDKLPQANACWTFDDPNNLLAFTGTPGITMTGAVETIDGIQRTASLAQADIIPLEEGPSAGNGAIGVPVKSYLWMNNGREEMLEDYTLMLDVRPETLDGYNSMYRNCMDPKDGSLFIKNGQLGLNVAGLGYHGELIQNKWHRIVAVVRGCQVCVYVDGKKVGESASPSPYAWGLQPDMLFFGDESGEEVWNDVAEIRYWDVPLTDKMVSELGSVEQKEVVQDPVPEPTGMWTFDNPADLLAGTGVSELYCAVRGEDGKPQRTEDFDAAGLVHLAGPAEDNGAVTVPLDTYLGINHNQDQAVLKSYAVMMDIKPKVMKGFQSLYQAIPSNDTDGSLFLRDNQIGINANGLGYNGNLPADKWMRVVFVLEVGKMHVYVDGVKVGVSAVANPNVWSMVDGSLFFADNDGEEGVIDVAEIRFWNDILTSSMVRQLGGVDDGTGISDVQDALHQASRGVYDLSGRRIHTSNLQKGVYIIDGRKVIVR